MLFPHPRGTLLHIRAQPGARREGIVGVQADRLKVAVHAAPEKGKANAALIKVIADELGLKRSQIQLLSGESSHQKTLLIENLTVETVRTLLADFIDQAD